MELFSRRRWRLHRPKWWAVVFMTNPQNYTAHAWLHSFLVWLLGLSGCLYPSTKDLRSQTRDQPFSDTSSYSGCYLAGHWWLPQTLESVFCGSVNWPNSRSSVSSGTSCSVKKTPFSKKDSLSMKKLKERKKKNRISEHLCTGDHQDLAPLCSILVRRRLEKWCFDSWHRKQCTGRAVVVAQLVEWLLPTPEVRGSNPVISKKLYSMFTVNCIEKTKIKKKRLGLANLKSFLFKNIIRMHKNDEGILVEDISDVR